MTMRVSKKNLRTFFAIHCSMWAVLATVGIIDAMGNAPAVSARVALCVAVGTVVIGLGTLFIRRPRR